MTPLVATALLGAVDLGSTEPVPGIPGVSAKRGVVLTAHLWSFLAALQPIVGAPVAVTSGVRTPSGQATVMLRLLLDPKKGVVYVRNLYGGGDLVNEILAVPQTHAAIHAVIEAQVRRGRFISRHLRGNGLDLRTRGLTAPEIARLRAAAEAIGAKVIDEGDHLHAGLPKDWTPPSAPAVLPAGPSSVRWLPSPALSPTAKDAGFTLASSVALTALVLAGAWGWKNRDRFS